MQIFAVTDCPLVETVNGRNALRRQFRCSMNAETGDSEKFEFTIRSPWPEEIPVLISFCLFRFFLRDFCFFVWLSPLCRKLTSGRLTSTINSCWLIDWNLQATTLNNCRQTTAVKHWAAKKNDFRNYFNDNKNGQIDFFFRLRRFRLGFCDIFKWISIGRK